MIACSFIVQTVEAYFIRDAMLMADNYFIGRNLQALDAVRDIQNEFIIENLCMAAPTEECTICKREDENKTIIFAFSEKSHCPSCGKIIQKNKEINIINAWLSAHLSKSNSIVNS